MSCLHTISKAPSARLLEQCLALLRSGDGLLFMEDGVYHCLEDMALELPEGLQMFALKQDLQARGLVNRNESKFEEVGYKRFVDLCSEFDKVIAWF